MTYDPDAILADSDAHPTHKRYAEINKGIRDRGERWAKCMNCGEPFQIVRDGQSAYACTAECLRAIDLYYGNLEGLS